MYKATREFINARDSFTGNFPPKHIVAVRRIGGGKENECYLNSHNAKDAEAEKGNRVVMISGWLVQPYNQATNSVSIVAHWWNADMTGQHFDTSPLISQGEEYVQDAAIYKYCIDNDHKLSTHLPYSLLYQNGKFEVLVDPEKMLFKPISELRTEYFYDLME